MYNINEIEELTKIATSTLSEVTHYTTVAIGPKTAMQNIEEIKRACCIYKEEKSKICAFYIGDISKQELNLKLRIIN